MGVRLLENIMISQCEVPEPQELHHHECAKTNGDPAKTVPCQIPLIRLEYRDYQPKNPYGKV